MSSAECLMHGAAHASQRAPPRPAPPHPAVNVDVNAHCVAPSSHATRAGAYGEVDVVAVGTHAASSVATAEWLAATLGGGDVNAGGPCARNGAVVDGLCPGSECRDTTASPSSYLLTVYGDDVDVTPLLFLLNAAPGGSGDGEDCNDAERGVTYARLYDDAQSDDDDDDSADILEAILGHVGRREDAGYDDDGVDVSVGVGVGSVVGVGVNVPSLGLSRCLSSCSVPPPHIPRLLGAYLRSRSLMTGHAASGGPLAPEPPRATGVEPESLRIIGSPFSPLFPPFSRFVPFFHLYQRF